MSKDKREKLTIAVSAEDKATLEKIALDLGQMWGNKPNISALMTAIAQGKIRLEQGEEPSPESKRGKKRLALAQIQEGLAKLADLL